MATLTVYPATGSGSTTVDGHVHRSGVNETLATIRAGAGVGTAFNSTTDSIAQLKASLTSNQFDTIYRGIFHFDTSALTASASISAATLSFYGASKQSQLGTDDLHVVSSTITSNHTLAASDYGQVGSTSFGSVAYASFSTAAYNDITLNASGISNISKTSVSKFATRLNWDLNNTSTGLTWGGFNTTEFVSYMADQTGTTNDPKLVVTYSTVNLADKFMIFFD